MRRRVKSERARAEAPGRLATLALFSLVFVLTCLVGALVSTSYHARLSAALIQAINQRDGRRAEHLLAQGADPNTRDWQTYFYQAGAPARPPWYEKYLARLTHRKPRPPTPTSARRS